MYRQYSLLNYSLNQLDDYIIPLLKSNPSTRRATASLWDPLIHSSLKIHQSPGLVFLDFKLRNNKLHLTAIVRSNDIFFGWPANIYQIFLIQKKIHRIARYNLVQILYYTVYYTVYFIFRKQ